MTELSLRHKFPIGLDSNYMSFENTLLCTYNKFLYSAKNRCELPDMRPRRALSTHGFIFNARRQSLKTKTLERTSVDGARF